VTLSFTGIATFAKVPRDGLRPIREIPSRVFDPTTPHR